MLGSKTSSSDVGSWRVETSSLPLRAARTALHCPSRLRLYIYTYI